MGIEPKIDLLSFNRLSMPAFVKRYRRDVRCMIHWNMLKKQKSGIKVLTQDDEVYLTRWSEGKSKFSFGLPRRLAVGNKPILVRVPGFKVKDTFFIVDGIHRIIELSPAMIVLDYICLEKEEYGIVVDFMGLFFSKLLNKD